MVYSPKSQDSTQRYSKKTMEEYRKGGRNKQTNEQTIIAHIMMEMVHMVGARNRTIQMKIILEA